MMCKVFDIESGWPCGVSDGLILVCGLCEQHTNFDYTVSNELWESVVPLSLQSGVICLDCLDVLAKKQGFFLGNHLISIQYTAHGETIILKPEITFVYKRII